APIRLHYLASEKQQFGCAINLAYLLNVDASVTTYEERPGFQGPKETIKLSGYTRGFSWLDTQLGIFYNRRLSRALSAQVEMFYGLTDIKNNGFFEKDQFERSSGLKLTLIYYTFRKNIEQ
ncbi:MAG TPA: hypothetical protein VEB42_02005, partial [Chitinophagaceae bacterium]|nr:hypothetical protein [Chitinophagaceae bacterium]